MAAKTFIRGLKTSVNASLDTFRTINLLANRPNPYAEHRSRVLFLKSTKKNTLARARWILKYVTASKRLHLASSKISNLERALRDSDSNIERRRVGGN